MKRRNKMQQQAREEQQVAAQVEAQLQRNPDTMGYIALLRRCGRAKALAAGRQVHSHLLPFLRSSSSRSSSSETLLLNLVVQMYGECGAIAEARRAFDAIPNRNLYSWNIMLSAYTSNKLHRAALDLFNLQHQQLKQQQQTPDRVAFVVAIRACTELGAQREGRLLHAAAVDAGIISDRVLATAIVSMYTRFGCIQEAKDVFVGMKNRDVVAWNAMIGAYVRYGQSAEALQLFEAMPVKADAGTFVAVVNACIGLGDPEQGERIHELITTVGMHRNVIVSTSLITMYGELCRIERAREVFDKMETKNVISWTAMMKAYVQNGKVESALQLYERMRSEGVVVDNVAYTIALTCAAKLRDLITGSSIHDQLEDRRGRNKYPHDPTLDPILLRTLADMYVTCGSFPDAERLAERPKQRATPAWNAVITAYARNGHSREMLGAYYKVERPDEETFIAVLGACSLAEGQIIHSHVVGKGLERDAYVAAALVSMYSKWGDTASAKGVFDEAAGQNGQLNAAGSGVLWSSLIAAYARNGQSEKASGLLGSMVQLGLRPNRVTFESFLRYVWDGEREQQWWWHFVSMLEDYGIRPGLEHYGALVHLLAVRLGKLQEARELLECMPFQPDASSWLSLLRGCITHDCSTNSSSSSSVRAFAEDGVLQMAKAYAQLGEWEKVTQLRQAAKNLAEHNDKSNNINNNGNNSSNNSKNKNNNSSKSNNNNNNNRKQQKLKVMTPPDRLPLMRPHPLPMLVNM